jgi:hypothetical protein
MFMTLPVNNNLFKLYQPIPMNYINDLIQLKVQGNLLTRIILQKILMANIELNDEEYLQIKEISKKMLYADKATFDLDFADKKKESEINLVLMTNFTDEDIDKEISVI